MALFESVTKKPISRRRFLKRAAWGAAGLAVYSSEIERHWLEISQLQISIAGLAPVFDGMRIAQLSDIHMDEYTEPFFLRRVVERINHLQPDMVLLTGDYVSSGIASVKYSIGAGWQCANILTGLECKRIFAVLGNHDVVIGRAEVTEALKANGVTVLHNSSLPIERTGGRFWLAGLDDPVKGDPDPESAIPDSIRNLPHEPVVLMCHAPDYVDTLLTHPVGHAIDWMLAGHTHGGQVRLPLLGALQLPDLGKKYVEGLFRLGHLQLYVNRGIGTVGVPFRFLCPPEITLFTLRAG